MRISYYTTLLLFVPSLFGASLSFDAAVEQFTEHNYDLQIARQEAQKSHAGMITAKERPNPILTGSYEFLDINNHFSDTARGSNAQATLLLSHPIETSGKRDRRINLAERAINYSAFIYDETVREQMSSLITAYYAVLSDQIDFENALDNAKAYNNLMTIAKAKFDNGFLSQIDFQKIMLQQIDYTREVEHSRLALSQDRERLASLLALSSSDITAVAPIDTSVEVLPTLDTLLNKVAERADCKAAKENLAVADAAFHLEKANAIPNISVGVEYASFGPTYEPLAGLNVSLPLPIYDRNEGDIEKARINTLQAASLYDKTLRMARADVIQSYDAARSSQSLYQVTTEGFATAKELKEKQEKIFALKGISILELLDAQKSYREYQKKLTHVMIDFHIAVMQLKLNSNSFPIESKGH